jgi:hypothetical protein
VNYDHSLEIYASVQMTKKKKSLSRHDMIRLVVRLVVGKVVDMCCQVVTCLGLRGMRMWKGRIGTSWVLPLSRIGSLPCVGFEGVCRARYSLLLGLYRRLDISSDQGVVVSGDSQTPSPAPRYIFSDELSPAHCYSSAPSLDTRNDSLHEDS